MAVDAALLAAAETGAAPVLRLFRFAPPGITLGAHQQPARELDLERCRRDGVAWAVRPTGGRAIFHADEWTYAFACPIDDPGWGGSLREAYDRVSALVGASLLRLGVPATLVAHGAHERGGGRAATPGPRAAAGPAAPCFASVARHEILIGGRKFVGSAQRRTSRALLQQGSVLLGDGHLRLLDYLALPDDTRRRERLRLAAGSAHAGRWLGSATPIERWGDALAAVLGPGVRRVQGPDGAFSLAPASGGPYTASRSRNEP